MKNLNGIYYDSCDEGKKEGLAEKVMKNDGRRVGEHSHGPEK